MTRSHEDALAEVLPDLVAEFGADLVGVLLTGSAATGQTDPDSDLDLVVLIRPPWRQRRARLVGGINVELFVNPVGQILREVDQPESPATILMFAQGRPVLDPDGTVAGLVAIAKERRSAGAPPLRGIALDAMRYRIADLVGDVGDLQDREPAGSRLLAGMAVDLVLDTHYRIHGRLRSKPKHLLADFDTWSPEVAKAARSALTAPTVALVNEVRALAELVLAPVGGMARVWVTEPEPLDIEDSAAVLPPDRRGPPVRAERGNE